MEARDPLDSLAIEAATGVRHRDRSMACDRDLSAVPGGQQPPSVCLAETQADAEAEAIEAEAAAAAADGKPLSDIMSFPPLFLTTVCEPNTTRLTSLQAAAVEPRLVQLDRPIRKF